MEQKKEQKEAKAKESSKKWGWFAFLLVFILLMWICGVFDSSDSTDAPSKPEYIAVNADVRFDRSQFIITNNDSFDWRNVQLEVNSGLIKSGYKLEVRFMAAGQTYTVGASRFAKSDGTRFTPFTMKPQKFEILCDTPKGRGFTSLGW